MMNGSHEAPRKRRGKILYVLLFALVVTGFVPVLFVAQKLIGLYEEELRGTLREKQSVFASAIDEALDAYVVGARSRAAKISETFSVLATLPSGDPARLQLSQPDPSPVPGSARPDLSDSV